MLSLVGIEKKYGSHIIFSNVNLEFNDGKLYVLQGVNGSGKSTLLKLISSIIYKTGGEMTLGNKISYLPDKFSFPKLMKVKKYLNEVISNDTDILNILSRYQIPNKRIMNLSKGNIQKLGIIQILLTKADIYLFDEPIDGLDEYAKKVFKEDIKKKLEENKIVIMALHNKTFFNDLTNSVIEIKEGFIHEKKKRND